MFLGLRAILTPVPKTPLVEEPTQEFNKISNKENYKVFFHFIF